jgi:hypothetical protein
MTVSTLRDNRFRQLSRQPTRCGASSTSMRHRSLWFCARFEGTIRQVLSCDKSLISGKERGLGTILTTQGRMVKTRFYDARRQSGIGYRMPLPSLHRDADQSGRMTNVAPGPVWRGKVRVAVRATGLPPDQIIAALVWRADAGTPTATHDPAVCRYHVSHTPCRPAEACPDGDRRRRI